MRYYAIAYTLTYEKHIDAVRKRKIVVVFLFFFIVFRVLVENEWMSFGEANMGKEDIVACDNSTTVDRIFRSPCSQVRKL